MRGTGPRSGHTRATATTSTSSTARLTGARVAARTRSACPPYGRTVTKGTHHDRPPPKTAAAQRRDSGVPARDGRGRAGDHARRILGGCLEDDTGPAPDG